MEKSLSKGAFVCRMLSQKLEKLCSEQGRHPTFPIWRYSCAHHHWTVWCDVDTFNYLCPRQTFWGSTVFSDSHWEGCNFFPHRFLYFYLFISSCSQLETWQFYELKNICHTHTLLQIFLHYFLLFQAEEFLWGHFTFSWDRMTAVAAYPGSAQ